MAKSKFANYDEAAEAFKATKEELAVAREEKKTYFKENGLSQKEDYSADAKHGKKVKKFQEMIDKKIKERDETEAWMKENKPKKERAVRATTYEYPDDITTAEDKKKYRAKQRAAKKKAEKGEAEEKPTKKEKKAKKEEAEAPAPESSKKDKKKKKDKASKKED